MATKKKKATTRTSKPKVEVVEEVIVEEEVLALTPDTVELEVPLSDVILATQVKETVTEDVIEVPVEESKSEATEETSTNEEESTSSIAVPEAEEPAGPDSEPEANSGDESNNAQPGPAPQRDQVVNGVQQGTVWTS